MRFSQWVAIGLISLLSFLSSTSWATDYPSRGMSMAFVKTHYGSPYSVKVSTGRVKAKWPRITVWNYGNFSVYFERNKVIHSVTH